MDQTLPMERQEGAVLGWFAFVLEHREQAVDIMNTQHRKFDLVSLQVR